MKSKLLKILLVMGAITILGLVAFTIWMRLGEEEARDYSYMDVELGLSDPKINGFTDLRWFSKTQQAEIPENYPLEYSESYALLTDYDLFENWNLEFFREILIANEHYLAATEKAFDRPQFQIDHVINLKTLEEETMPVYLSLRSYVRLRFIEARVLALSGEPDTALARLEDLYDELGKITRSGGGYIGLLTSIASNRILLQ